MFGALGTSNSGPKTSGRRSCSIPAQAPDVRLPRSRRRALRELALCRSQLLLRLCRAAGPPRAARQAGRRRPHDGRHHLSASPPAMRPKPSASEPEPSSPMPKRCARTSSSSRAATRSTPNTITASSKPSKAACPSPPCSPSTKWPAASWAASARCWPPWSWAARSRRASSSASAP